LVSNVDSGRGGTHELSNLFNDPVLVTDPGDMIIAGQLDVSRSRDACAELPARQRAHAHVITAMHDESGHPDSRQNGPHIDLAVHAMQVDDIRRTGAQAFELGERLNGGRIAGQ
jgi:hypothetical protein